MIGNFKFLLACLSIFLVSCSAKHGDVLHDSILEELEDLDAVLNEVDVYVDRKKGNIDSLTLSLASAVSYEERKAALKSLIREYHPYQFDSAEYYIVKTRDLAFANGDIYEATRQNIALGSLYTNAGYYMEAYSQLFAIVDEDRLPDGLRRPYYRALYSLADNLAENSIANEGFGRLQDPLVYIDTLLTLSEPGSTRWHTDMLTRLMHTGNFAEAKELNHRLMERSVAENSSVSPMLAFHEAVICDSLGLAQEKLYWEIQAAKSDMRYVVKDYASLSMVAKDLMAVDVDRSFRYMKIALADALFYNARLRPWQISQFMLTIQDSYDRNQEIYHSDLKKKSMLLTFFVVALSLFAVALAVFYFKLRQSMREVESLNGQLLESNVKLQQLITRYMSLMSDNINHIRDINNSVVKKLKYGKQNELLTELSYSTVVEDELKKFYETFDATFLAMYPSFVEQFNELLKDDQKCYPSKGEKLNTGLRVFALVRLGIEDSDEIASLLKYSVRTVYNYKVKLRNASKYPRDKFDALVKKIR